MTEKAAAAPAVPAALLSAFRDTLVLFALTGAIWLLHVYGRTLPSLVLAAAWAALTAIIAWGLFKRARIRRAAFLLAYVEPSSPLSRCLRGGFIMAAHAGLLAAALALVLMLAVIRLADGAAWVVLVVSAPAFVLTRALAARVFGRHARRGYLPELAWRTTAAVVGAFMFAALVWLAFHRSYPALGGVGLDQAVWHFVDAEQARSAWVGILLKIAAAKDGLRLWLAEQLMPRPGASLVQAAGWLIVLAEDAVFVWSYLLLYGGVLVSGRGAASRGRRAVEKAQAGALER
ncbi:MAG TPA: hypothetical protein VFY39_00035 [Gammaproteobacteria bacterium]|nr:hypothetical protein [Gammaproteobacteria bacterium]